MGINVVARRDDDDDDDEDPYEIAYPRWHRFSARFRVVKYTRRSPLKFANVATIETVLPRLSRFPTRTGSRVLRRS